jgi:hypothetical protein
MGVRRLDADWMQQLDERILEYLADEGWATPGILARDLGLRASRGRIRERCRALQYAGLAAPFAGECYEVTTGGQRYLEGELDAAHQPRSTAGCFGVESRQLSNSGG